MSNQRQFTAVHQVECDGRRVEGALLACLNREGDTRRGEGMVEVILVATVEHYGVMASRSPGFSTAAEISFGKLG